MASLSGEETGPPADNLVSNEDSYPRVAGELARRAPAGSVYLGVGPDQNFTLIGRGRPDSAFIVDHRRRNGLLHLVHKALFALAPDRVDYLGRLTARNPIPPPPADPTAAELIAAFGPAKFDRGRLDRSIAEVAATLRPLGVVAADEWATLASIQSRLAGPGLDARFLALRMYPTLARAIATPDHDGRPAHFLSDESSYRVVRDLQRDDRVVPLVGDFAGPGCLPKLAAWLRETGRTLGVAYLSDVEFFLLRSGRFPAFAANLARFPLADEAIVVRSSTREIDHPERQPGDSSTTIVRPLRPFLDEALAGRVRAVDDLFPR